MRSAEVVTRAGITYRQLNVWVERGWLTPDRDGSGSGHAFDWDWRETQVAVDMGALVDAGFKPETAATLARSLRAVASVDLGGFVLTRKQP